MLSKMLFQNYFQKCFSKMLSKSFFKNVFKKNDSSKIHVFKKHFYRVKENGFQIVVKKNLCFPKESRILQKRFFFPKINVFYHVGVLKNNKIKKVFFFSRKCPIKIFSKKKKKVSFQNNKVSVVTFYFKHFS